MIFLTKNCKDQYPHLPSHSEGLGPLIANSGSFFEDFDFSQISRETVFYVGPATASKVLQRDLKS